MHKDLDANMDNLDLRKMDKMCNIYGSLIYASLHVIIDARLDIILFMTFVVCKKSVKDILTGCSKLDYAVKFSIFQIDKDDPNDFFISRGES